MDDEIEGMIVKEVIKYGVAGASKSFLEMVRIYTRSVLNKASSAGYSSIRRLLKSSMDSRLHEDIIALGSQDSKFVNWGDEFKTGVYAAEASHRLYGLPYSKLGLWKDLRDLKLRILPDPFELEDGGKEWSDLIERGFSEINADRPVFDQRDESGNLRYAIRLKAYDRGGPDAPPCLTLQRALYTQQAKSNLLADYSYKGSAMEPGTYPTLRQRLAREQPGLLPLLGDGRLANTVGVSVLMLYNDDDGNIRPLIQPRKAKGAAMSNTGIHCTGSIAAAWPRSDQRLDAENFFLDEAETSLRRDFGLRKADFAEDLHMMGLVREYARLGKPQVFFYGMLKISADEIVERKMQQQEEEFAAAGVAAKGQQAAEAKYRPMARDEMKDLLLENIWKAAAEQKYPFTQEAAAMLSTLSNEFGMGER